MLYAWYMSKFIGNKFLGVITSIVQYGMFVELDNGAEGLLSFSNMDSYYDYDESSFSASNGKKTFKLGDRIEVVIIKADKDKHQIDFVLASEYKEGLDYENNMPK